MKKSGKQNENLLEKEKHTENKCGQNKSRFAGRAHNKEASYPINHLCGGEKNLNMLALGIAQQIQEAVSRYAH